jgi:glycosyltransferase involved in cell wall biosynthesis
MPNTPKITVAIPCYNGGIYLKDAFESVLNQTFKDFEVVYIDDQSTDGSFEVAQSFAEKDPRVRVLRNPKNLGMVGNWNRCLEESQGEYIKLLCADDILYSNCLLHQFKAMESNPEATLATCPSLVINSKSKDIISRDPFFVTRLGTAQTLTFKQLLRKSIQKSANLIGEPSLTLMRRQRVLSVGFFDSGFRYGTDLEYWLRLLSNNSKIVITPQVDAGFRLHPGSLTNVQMARGLDEMAKIFQQYADLDDGFDLELFRVRYGRQTRLKSLIIKHCESSIGRLLLSSADRLRTIIRI